MAATYPQLDLEEDVLRAALEQLQSRLPTPWSLTRQDDESFRPRRVDAAIKISDGTGQEATIFATVKKVVSARDLRNTVDQLRERADGLEQNLLVVARYLPAPTQEWLAKEGVSYADATGNLRVILKTPPLFVRDVGAKNDPWRGPGRPRGTLVGEPSARVVRALADFAPPYSVPMIMKLANASSGPTYRVVEFLEQQELLTRDREGQVSNVHWRALLKRWSADYTFQQNSVTTFLQPRGLARLLVDLGTVNDLDYAVTGSLAARNVTENAPPRAAMIYCSDPGSLAQRLSLSSVETGVNVLIAKPRYNVVYARSHWIDSVRFVAPSQAVVDLMSGPGRNPSEAEALLDWMEVESNEKLWRL
jgi:hypothetical protein